MIGGGRPVALVTGASAGIGAELVRQLARDGHDLVLAARSLAPMQALAEEVSALGAEALVLEADLSRPGAAARLAQEIADRGLAVDVLVNNAGLGAVGPFERTDPGRIGEMVYVNIVALTELTRLILPQMVARRRGRIMLVGSTAGFLPGPRMAVYFASKAYVLSFGEALAEELRGTGVSLSVLCPGATDTNFFAVAGYGEAAAVGPMMSAAAVARIGCRGLAAGRRVVIAGLTNRILATAARLAPRGILLPIVARINSRR